MSDAAHRERIDRIVARNRKDTLAIGHDDVLALASDAEASLFERSHGPEMVDTGYPGHGLYGDLDLADYRASGILDRDLHVLADGIRDGSPEPTSQSSVFGRGPRCSGEWRSLNSTV